MSAQDERNNFANNLQYYMDVNGISRFDLCDALHIKYSTLSEWLQAKKFPRLDNLQTIAAYFGISRGDLLEPPAARKDPNLDKLVHLYNDMNDIGQERLIEQAEFLHEKHKKSNTVSDIAE